ncbi:hypothetical protein OS493_008641 [Desmophyllum pertusum]|uniref:Uncharacterized protein n=1 Tax=Desmophyllum pertusum TaxID=174260 RepID=A0A9W9ZRF8_9CNID|nr:hypothetical protein OS493_008641 [Desmophyllum pertusum]
MQKHHEEIMSFHKKFQSTVDEKQLESNLKYFSEKPHIAGSLRQIELAKELARRWKEDNGFDKVEMPEYQVLLSKPDEVNKTRITIKYKNGHHHSPSQRRGAGRRNRPEGQGRCPAFPCLQSQWK